jgi:formiminotetrahydrofolate cyclodeaminase
MPTYSTLPLADVLDAFASNDPLPGGGSASALAGALGVSLLLMVAGHPKTRTGAPEEVADLAQAAARLRPLREVLTSLVDRDSDAYRAVLNAFRLPQNSDAEKTSRRDAIQSAFRSATDVPLETMRACQQALRGALVVLGCGARIAATDAGVAVELLLAAVRGSGLNVSANLGEVKDQTYVTRVEVERRQLESDSTADAASARALL